MFRMNRQIGSLTFNVLTLISIHSVDGKNNNKEKRKQGMMDTLEEKEVKGVKRNH